MKIAAIKKAVENYSIEELQAAEQAILEEKKPEIAIDGEDEGEQLTHVLAAIEIRKDIQNGTEEKQALRNYTQRVRNSIS
ncbi:MAG: DUF6952 family protein [Luteibaculum sp.]